VTIKTSINTGFSAKKMVIILYISCLLPIAIFAYRKPLYNWDMLAYMALIVRIDHKDPVTIHQVVYSSAKETIPNNAYDLLINSGYRKKMADSPGEFYQQLPFYSVKPFYTGMTYLFYKAGFSLPVSTVLPSILSCMLIGVLLFYWLQKYLGLFFTFSAGLLIMYSGIMIESERLSSPDALSAFFLLFSFYVILEKPSWRWLTVLLALSIFTRLDNVIAGVLIASFLFFIKKSIVRISLKQYVLMLIVLIASYAATSLFASSFGWDMLYYPSFARHLDLSHAGHASFSFKAYGSLFVSAAITGLLYYHVVFFVLLGLLLIYTPSFRLRQLSFDQMFAGLLLFIILIRFILFPDLTDRFYIAYYICILLLLVKRYVTSAGKTAA
jgi:hypothetical protein